jgi:hypothetical protein
MKVRIAFGMVLAVALCTPARALEVGNCNRAEAALENIIGREATAGQLQIARDAYALKRTPTIAGKSAAEICGLALEQLHAEVKAGVVAYKDAQRAASNSSEVD